MASKSVEITCPDCGAAGTVEMWTSINLDENPPMEEKVRSGSLFRYACPECGIVTKVAYPTLIHAPSKKRMIYLATEQNMFEDVIRQFAPGGSTASNELLANGYMVRAARSVPELSELMRVLHAELDDRVVALMKLFVYQEVRENNPDYEVDNLYFMDRDDSDTEYHFELQCRGETIGQIGFDREAYDNMQKMFQSTIDSCSKGVVVIDAAWAGEVFEAYGKSHPQS